MLEYAYGIDCFDGDVDDFIELVVVNLFILESKSKSLVIFNSGSISLLADVTITVLGNEIN